MDILKALNGEIAHNQLLDEIMRDRLLNYVGNDYNGYISCSNKSNYQMSSYAVTFTFYPKKVHKKFGLSLLKDDNAHIHSVIRNALRHFVLNHVKEYMAYFTVELTKKGVLHYHGIAHGPFFNIDRVARWWRRNVGFVKENPLTNSYQCWLEYITKNQVLNPFFIWKEAQARTARVYEKFPKGNESREQAGGCSPPLLPDTLYFS